MRDVVSLLRWRMKRGLLRARQRFCARFYRDRHPETGRAMVVAGTGRSGTTWAVDIIRSQLACREMFEPFHPARVPTYGGYHYFQYMRPGGDDPRLEEFCRRLLRGDIRNAWIDRRISVLRPEWRVVKTIRGLLLLRWLEKRFPEVPVVFIIRHPCAVVASRLQLGWATDGDIAPFLDQPELIEDFLEPVMDVIRGARTAEEKHAVVWSVSNFVPLSQFPAGGLKVVFYERLCTDPEVEVPRLFRAIRHPFDDSVFRRLRTPSGTARPTSAVVRHRDPITAWRGVLSAEEEARVRAVVRAFGLDHLYGDGDLPLPGAGDAGEKRGTG